MRRQRERLLGSPRTPSHDDDADRDPLDFIASESPGPNDRLARRERVARSGEALQALKPQEVRALTLKAQGYSYAEIGEMTGWSYTKINRCMAEGRKRFLQVFADIEQGRRCEELATRSLGVGRRRGSEMDRPTRWSSTCGVAPPAGRSSAPIGRFPARSSTCCLPDRSSITRWAAAHTSGSPIAPQPPSTRFAKRAIHSSRVEEVEAAARPPPSPLRAAREVQASPRSRRCSQSVARRLPGALRASRRDWLIQEWWKAGKDPTIRSPRWSVPRSQWILRSYTRNGPNSRRPRLPPPRGRRTHPPPCNSPLRLSRRRGSSASSRAHPRRPRAAAVVASSVARPAVAAALVGAAEVRAGADSGSRGEGAELERTRTQVGDVFREGDRSQECRRSSAQMGSSG